MRKSFAKSRLARSITSALERLENRVLFSTASLVKIDTTTKGNWSGVYGADGYSVIGASASLPAYATYSVSGNSFYEWEAQNSGDTRAPQTNPGSPVRVAATDYSGTSETYNLNISDGKTHQVAFYLLDQDFQNRKETITITDASSSAVLATNDITNFSGGDYVVYNVSGNVKVTIANDSGSLNAVNSGIFFDPGPGGSSTVTGSAGSATLLATDTTTQGNWTGVYGADGFSVVGGTTSLPAYATFGVTGNQFYQWQAPGATDSRALQVKAGDSQRVAATDFSGTSETFDVNLTDGKTHQVALYVLDQDNRNRSETVTITDANTNSVLSTTDVHSFAGGKYLVYTLGGHVKVTITNDAGSLNAVASGLFFGPATSTGPMTLTVGPGKQFGTIQAAVNAASPGDTIDVYSGTYTEQVTIPLGLDNLTLESAPGQTVTIKAPSSLDSTGAIVRIDGSKNTVLQGFTITGPGQTSGTLKYGVLVDAAGTATIQNNDVTHIEDATFGATDGVGYGIAVIDGSAKILSNIVDNYQKGGILIGLTPSITGSPTWTQVGDVENNFVTGVGGTAQLTQNGIIYAGLRATGTAKMNHVAGNSYTANNSAFGNAAGILVFDAGNGVTVLNNIAYNNDTDIVIDGGTGPANTRGSNFAVVSGNTVYNATVFDGIDLTDGVTQVTVSQNYSHNNPFDGIFIDSNTSGNTINNNIFANNGEFDINDQTYSASNLNKAPLYGTLNFYSNNTFGKSNDPSIPSS